AFQVLASPLNYRLHRQTSDGSSMVDCLLYEIVGEEITLFFRFFGALDLDEDKFSDFISKVDLDEDKFSDFISKVDLDEDNKLSGLQEMIIDGKKNMNGVEIEIRSTKNKLYNMLENNLNSNTNFAIPCEAKDEMNYKTFTEALGVFDYVLQAII
ncbi:10035_t:CDS:2, partial [Gigaspora rosea]